MFVSDAQEAAETQHGIIHLAGTLADHDALDRADLVAVRSVDVGSFHLVAADQVVGFFGLAHAVLHLVMLHEATSRAVRSVASNDASERGATAGVGPVRRSFRKGVAL